jgi:molybdopterin-guanine dinucleotide biosynthesis protein A
VLDLDPGSGPAAGLAAAFGLEPRSAWLVVAADMPLLDDELLRGLVAARDPRKVATAYRHPDGTLEPLCTIWEPAAVPLLEACGAPRRSVSLRRVLEGAPVHAIAARDPKRLGSVNTAAEDEAARTYLAGTGAATSEP